MLSSLRARITLAMASLVLLLAVASIIAVREVSVLEGLSSDVAAIDEAARRVQSVATAMRDAYAHQAHMVILDDRSHLDHYSDTHRAALAAVDEARATLTDEADLADLALIERGVRLLDASFRRDLLPAIPGGTRELATAHDRAIHLVESAQLTADRLSRRLEERAAAIHAEVAASRARLAIRCALLLGVALVLAVAVALVLDRQVSAPVRALAVAAERLGDGELSTRVQVGGDHELAVLARAFNEMARELAERQQRLIEAERLAGIGRLAAGVAHEMNNPLGVMLGYVRLLERHSDEGVRSDAATVRAEIRRCQDIVAGLLDLARPARLARTDLDVVALVQEAAAPLPPLSGGASRTRIHAPATCTAAVDEGKVLQVLRNLFQNAVEAAPDDAFDITIEGGPSDVTVSIADAGPGLSPEARSRLFEPFFTSKPKGTGLGLAVSRSFAEAHGGTLTVKDVGAGACFVLRLPRVQEKSS